MSTGTAWQETLRAPRSGDHIAQLYTERKFLARVVAMFLAGGVLAGEAVWAVATPLHWRAITEHLQEHVDVQAAQDVGQLLVLDAHDTLAALLDGGGLDRGRFRALVDGMIETTVGAGFRSIRAFGEMVDLLRQSDQGAAIRLEGLWNEVLREHRIAMLCPYSVDVFDPAIYRGLLQQMSATHSHLIPVDDYARLDHAVARAYADVFGGGEDAEALRFAFLKHYQRPTASMPDAEAAILALRELIPDSAERLLERVRRHYTLGRPSGS